MRQLPWSADDILSGRGSCGVIHGSNSGVFGDDNFTPGVPTYTYGLCEICKSIIKHAHALIRHELTQYNIECAEYLESIENPDNSRLDRLLPKKADEIGLPSTIARFVYEACKLVNETCSISSDLYNTDCDEVRRTIDAVLSQRDYCGVETDNLENRHLCSRCETLIVQIWKHIADIIVEHEPLLDCQNQQTCSALHDMYSKLVVEKHLAEFSGYTTTLK